MLDIDFSQIEDLKEDSVRECVISPLLKSIGFSIVSGKRSGSFTANKERGLGEDSKNRTLNPAPTHEIGESYTTPSNFMGGVKGRGLGEDSKKPDSILRPEPRTPPESVENPAPTHEVGESRTSPTGLEPRTPPESVENPTPTYEIGESCTPPHKLEMVLQQSYKATILIGSDKKVEANLMPDYTLYVDSKAHCILEAKACGIKISKDSKAEKQALSYATQFKTPFYALCNGREFMLFKTDSQESILQINLESEFKRFENHSGGLRGLGRNESSVESKNFTESSPRPLTPPELAIPAWLLYPDSKLYLLHKLLTTPLESFLESIRLIRHALHDKHFVFRHDESWYMKQQMPSAIFKPRRRVKKRHFGNLAYFTRQSWDVVTQNILNFTQSGDIVLDPFGGSGVSAIEAMINGRIGVHIDLNPLSVFIVKALCAKVDVESLKSVSEEILEEFENLKPKSEREVNKILKESKYYKNSIDKEFGQSATAKVQNEILWIPRDEMLPKGSDVDSVLKLFTKRQIVELALLRRLIFKKTMPSGSVESRKQKKAMRYSLMLAFRNTITNCNLTYHSAGGGDAGAYRYYRYRIAPRPDVTYVSVEFKKKLKRMIEGKKELESAPEFYASYFYETKGVLRDVDNTPLDLAINNGEKILQSDATNLVQIKSESIDFIYTDPPYGSKIPYLDLSVMWNAWLDFEVGNDLREKECIEKGSLEKSRYEYYDLMKAALKEMYRVLKFNRWLAFVFQHQDPKLWQIIIDSAENIGFEYVGSVKQDSGQASFKKLQNPATVLKGQIIIYFKKVDNAKARSKLDIGVDVLEQMFKDIEEIIVENDGATLEHIWNDLVIKSMNNGYLHLIANKFKNFIPAINDRFELDPKNKYQMRENSAFSNFDIPIEKRVRYLIRSALDKTKQGISFDELVLNIIPLSKNGIQANNDLVRSILKDIAYQVNKDTGIWCLKENMGKSLFGY